MGTIRGSVERVATTPICVYNAKNFIFTFLVFYTEILYVPFKYIWRVLFYHKLFCGGGFVSCLASLLACLPACLPDCLHGHLISINTYKSIYHIYNTPSVSQSVSQLVLLHKQNAQNNHPQYTQCIISQFCITFL